MTEIEKCILANQTEILWTLRRLLERADPDLVGRGGEVDRMRDDLIAAAKRTQAMLNTTPLTRPKP